mmetsp:Transcript_49372/g.154833  ORF Transcript_49372/g.154833 Transcript_49372/m.154833 type:complete len:202 (+) Transcript_49372:534-1139(+)
MELFGPGVFSVNDDHLPISLAFIHHAQHSKNLHRPDLSCADLAQTNLTDIEGVVVSSDSNIRVDEVGILPGAGEAAVVEVDVALLERSQLTLLLVLLDRVERLLRCELKLLPRPLGNLAHEVESSSGLRRDRISLEQRQIMPQGSVLTLHHVLGVVTSVCRVFRSMHLRVEVLMGENSPQTLSASSQHQQVPLAARLCLHT